jgi:hypothetical protein
MKQKEDNDKKVEKQIEDLTIKDKKYLCRKFLKTSEGQSALIDLKGIKKEEKKESCFGLFMFLAFMLWISVGVYYYDYDKTGALAWLSDITKYLFTSTYSMPIILTLLLLFIEVTFIYILFDNNKKQIKNIKSISSIIKKFNCVALLKVAAVMLGIWFFALFIIAIILLLLPLKAAIPFLIILELWIRNNPLWFLSIVIAIISYIMINYILVHYISKSSVLSENKEIDDDMVIEALRDNPNIEVVEGKDV